MLKHLYISQYALIESLDLDLDGGFLVITGETGAGKSIIMGALGLIMGDRADTKVIRSGAAKSVIEATFVLKDGSYKEVFADAELDYSDECIIRREITSTGKSRAFINDTPVNQTVLRAVTSRLVDIHSQYENLLLKDGNFQLSVVDTAAHNDRELGDYRSVFDEYNECSAKLKQVEEEAAKWREEKEYLQYQFDRIDEAGLSAEEQEQLEQELELLNHTEEIKTEIGAAVELLGNDEYGIIPRMKEAVGRVGAAARYLADAKTLDERMGSLYIELKDIDNELSRQFEALDYDPARKAAIEARLDTIYSLEQKYHLQSCAELIDLRDSLADKLERIDNFDEEISELQKAQAQIHERLDAAARLLSDKRCKVSGEIAEYLTAQLVSLGIANAKVSIDVQPLKSFSATGADDVRFLFSANKNMPLRPIVSVASGGEIARVMLALKSLTVRKSNLSTIIFDEIDTGVSGEIAGRMAEMMQTMADHVQVVAITHLPQIAARGRSHYKVFKTDTDNSTTTNISLLSPEQREQEIAEMLSGKNPSDAALNAARELLKH